MGISFNVTCNIASTVLLPINVHVYTNKYLVHTNKIVLMVDGQVLPAVSIQSVVCFPAIGYDCGVFVHVTAYYVQ